MNWNTSLFYIALSLSSTFCGAFAPASTIISNSKFSANAAVENACQTSSTARSALLLEGVGAAVDTFFQTQPYMSAFLTCSVKASAADLVAQKRKVEETDDVGADPFDIGRNLAFIVYGGFYQGCAQHFIYNDLFPTWFGTDSSLETVLSKVMAEMIVFGPMVCLPIAYTVKSAFTSNEQYLDIVKVGLNNYIGDIMERFLLFRYWGIWFPAHCLTFSVVPDHFRIAFVACVSFFWVVLLSSVSAESSEVKSAAATPVNESPSSSEMSNLIPARSNQF